MKCRFCSSNNCKLFVDLGHMAIANAFVAKEQLSEPEVLYPLKVFVCEDCFLVQVDEYESRESIFSHEYVYFSSISQEWLKHCRAYVQKANYLFGLDKKSFVIEIASNDGYLLQYFKEYEIPCLGIEPTRSTADEAAKKGIETVVDFFDINLAKKLVAQNRTANLIIGNNVLPHVPKLNEFVRGLKLILQPEGVITMEFPHLYRLIEKIEFDTIYHEHFSYFSFYTVQKIFEKHGMKIFDVEELETHGGSLRIYVKHEKYKDKLVSSHVYNLTELELSAGMNKLCYYKNFSEKIKQTKNKFLKYLIDRKLENKKIVAFGAAAKGNTFLNYCGIKADLIEYVVDETLIKQGKYLPQSHIPVVPLEKLERDKPDIIVILPWNFEKEIIAKLAFTREWGAKIATYIPELKER